MGQYGAVIGGVIGAIIGSVVPGVGTAFGWAIGSALGGAYSASQQVLPGPTIGDVQKQTSQEGGFRPFVYGRSIPMMGNVIADGGPKIVRKEESQGKGGPKVATEYAYRTYAVGFCEGEALLLQAWRNGILVYDTEDPSMSAENSKFLEYATWHTGSFEQMQDPALQAIYGAANAPFFRGTAYLVLDNEDVTDIRGAWAQWQVRVFRGAAKLVTTPPYRMESWEDSYNADANLTVLQLKNTSNMTGQYSADADMVSIVVETLREIQSITMADYDADTDLTAIEVRQMRVTLGPSAMQETKYSADTDLTAIEVLQTRVVLNTMQETKYAADTDLVSIEVIVP